MWVKVNCENGLFRLHCRIESLNKGEERRGMSVGTDLITVPVWVWPK